MRACGSMGESAANLYVEGNGVECVLCMGEVVHMCMQGKLLCCYVREGM